MISIKMHSSESNFFIGSSNILACMCALSSLEISQAGAVEGLMMFMRVMVVVSDDDTYGDDDNGGLWC